MTCSLNSLLGLPRRKFYIHTIDWSRMTEMLMLGPLTIDNEPNDVIEGLTRKMKTGTEEVKIRFFFVGFIKTICIRLI